MNRLRDKVAIVTGAGSGIGRASALLFAREGARLVLADVNSNTSAEVGKAIQAMGGAALSVPTDVSVSEDVKALIDATIAHYGRIDVLFNNAAMLGTIAPTTESTFDNWDRVINTNLRSVFAGMHYAIPEMLKNGGGSIVNTASIDGLQGRPGLPAYCAAKGGVIQLTRATAMEYGRQGIRINCICPGGIWTGIAEAFVDDAVNEAQIRAGVAETWPIGRMGEADEIAAIALFLASDEASFCTGAVFVGDGGVTAGVVTTR